MNLWFSVKNVLIKVEPMMVVVQVDLVFAAHVSFTPVLFILIRIYTLKYFPYQLLDCYYSMDLPSLFGWLDKYSSIMCSIQLIFITVSISCGTSNSENNSYLVQSSCTSCTSPCKYKICPCSTSVCRIRYDFSVSKSFAIPYTLSINHKPHG